MSANRRSSSGATSLAVTASVVCSLPLFLTGALAVELTREFAFGSAGLGVAVAMNRLTGAVMSPSLGRLSDHFGATRSIRVAAVIATVAAFGIATTAHRWAVLVAWLMVLGCANAIVLPASNRLLSNLVSPHRLGLAFGVKQSAPPTSAMLAGLSVPVIALTIGWRAAYVLAGVLGLIVVFAAGRQPPRPSSPASGHDRPLAHAGVLKLLSAGFGLGNVANSSLTTFYVDAAVAAGSSQRFAGTILAVASVAAIAMRVLAGLISDRRADGHLELCAGLMVAGSAGIAMLVFGNSAWMAAGAIIALGSTWGFAGVFWFAIVRAYPETPGKASGIIFPGALLGGTIGPTLFGVAADNLGYRLAWALSGLLVLVAAGTTLYGAKRLRKALASNPKPD